MTTSEIFAQQNQRRKNTATASGVAKPEVKKRLLSAATVGGTADGDGKAARRQPRIQLYRPPAASKKHVTMETAGDSGRNSPVSPPRGSKQSKAAANSSETAAAVTKDWSGVKTFSEILRTKQQQQRRKPSPPDEQQADVSDEDVDDVTAAAKSRAADVPVSETSHVDETTSNNMTSHKAFSSSVVVTTVSDNRANTAAATENTAACADVSSARKLNVNKAKQL